LPPGVLDRIHEGRHPKWDAVLAAQRERGGVELWTTPEANTSAANIYLMTGRYPRLVGPTPEGHGAMPPAGALVIGLKPEEASLRAMGEMVVSESDIRVVEVVE
jgi:hypothetical protein